MTTHIRRSSSHGHQGGRAGREGAGSFSSGQTWALLAMGGVSLALGLLVYLTDRATAHALWVPAGSALTGRHLFGVVGLWLPSFVHPLAFGLLSGALLPPRPRWQIGACLFWLAVNAAFEIGQHPQVRAPLAGALRRVFGEGPVAGAVENYFLRGTFDGADLVAAALGAALAAAILRRLCAGWEEVDVATPRRS